MFRSQPGEGKSHIVTQGPICKKGKRENNKDRIDLVISDIIMQVVERSCYEGNVSKS